MNLNSNTEALVLDASAMVDLLLDSPSAPVIRKRLRGSDLHAPAHFDAEVLSALGRLYRAGCLTGADVTERLAIAQRAPILRHGLAPLLLGAWERRGNLRLTDALYVELAQRLDSPILTTDARMAAVVPQAETLEIRH